MKLFKTAAILALLLPSLSFAQVANITRIDSALTGISLTASATTAISNTYFDNDGYTLLHVKGGGSAVTATFISQQTSLSKQGYGSISLSNQTVSIPSATNLVFGPFPTARWNTTSGTVAVSFTAVTGVSVTAIRDTTDGR